MSGLFEVSGGVEVRGRIAASHMAALEADTQADPFIARLLAGGADRRRQIHERSRGGEVCAGSSFGHGPGIPARHIIVSQRIQTSK